MAKIIYNLVYNRKKRLNRKGMALVQVEAYLGRKKKYFSTNVYLKPHQWDAHRQKVRNHPQQEALNYFIHSVLMEIEQQELDLWRQGQCVSLEMLKTAMYKETFPLSFCTFYRQEVIASTLKESTRQNHLSTLRLLHEFKDKVAFEELTFLFISDFGYFLRQKGIHTNTIAKHLKHLKRYVNIAINKGYLQIEQYPFRKYRIQTVESHHTHLTPEELALLERLSSEKCKRQHQHVLDAFLFCCYAGLRYSDFVSLGEKNLVEIAGKTWLIYNSVKTGIEVRIPLYLLFGGKALAVVRRYRTQLGAFFRLDNNSNVNKVLQRLAQSAGLQKHISFHTARHTNATLLIYSGISITTVQKLLGHKSVKTTQLYTNIMDRTIVQDLQRAVKRRS